MSCLVASGFFKPAKSVKKNVAQYVELNISHNVPVVQFLGNVHNRQTE